MKTADFLASFPLFRSLGPEVATFAQMAREKSYPKSSVILFEDDPGDSLFVAKAA